VAPSIAHEGLLLLFRNRPELAPELLRASLDVELPPYSEVRIESADLSDLAPAEYRADLVVLLVDGKPVLAIVVEVQLQRDERKRYTWPVYMVGLRARFECPACVLVVTADDATAAWARTPIDLGPRGMIAPLVVGPSAVPLIEDAEAARLDPELAVLSVMAHGTELSAVPLVRTAFAALSGLDADRQVLYSDLMAAALSDAVRTALEDLMASGNYVFQSEWAKKHQAIGREEGREQGRVAGTAHSLLKLLETRGLVLSPAQRMTIEECTDLRTLESWFERAVTAKAVDDVFSTSA
jgi:hypothetical protein